MKPNFGLLPLSHDTDKDFKVGAIFVLPKPETLPENFSLGEPDIEHQGDTDMCSAYATCGSSEFQEGVFLDPYSSFAKGKEFSKNIDGWGQDLNTAMSVHVKWGAIPEGLDISQINNPRDFKQYPKGLDELAKKHKKQTYVSIQTFGMDSFDAIRSFIYKFRDEKRAVILGVQWGWDLSQKIMEESAGGFGHAIYCIGWKTINNKPYLIIVNSYGKEAGDNGLHYFSRQIINRDVSNFGSYAFIDKPREDVEYMLENGIKEGDTWVSALFKVLLELLKSPFATKKEKDETTIKVITEVVKHNTPKEKPVTELIYEAAVSCLGNDIARTQNEFGCAEAVSHVRRLAFGDKEFQTLSTAEMFNELKNNKKFKSVTEPKRGTIIISPTGRGNRNIKHGHVGIFGDDGKIMSNDSFSFKWSYNFTIDSWVKYYRVKGGYPIFYYERVAV